MFKAVIGNSEEIDTPDAIDEILKECHNALEGATPNAGLLFSATSHDLQYLLDTLNKKYPGLELIGCTTDGEMSAKCGYTEDSITLALFASDEIEIKAGIGLNASKNAAGAATDSVNMASSAMTQEVKLAITLPDGLTTNAYQVLEGMEIALGKQIPIVGGMSADQVVSSKQDFETYQFYKGKVCTDSAPVLLFGGPLLYSLGVESGWSPISEKMEVTKSDGYILKELDGKRPLDVYKHYLGHISNDNLTGLGAYPLAIYEKDFDKFYLRVPSKADTETGSITFLGDIPIGTTVQITQAIRDNVLDGVIESVNKAKALYPGQHPKAVMLFSCTGRKLALGSKTKEEIKRVRNAIPIDVPMFGFYTFGEIGPLSAEGRARYHNTTFVTLLLGTN